MVLIRHFVFSENGYASTDEDASEFSQASEGGYEYIPTVHDYHEIIYQI